MKATKTQWVCAVLLGVAISSLACEADDELGPELGPELGLEDDEPLEPRHTWWNFAFIRTHSPAWDMCMDVAGKSTQPGTLVNQFPCKSTTQSHFPDDQNQRFFLSPIMSGSSTFAIVSPLDTGTAEGNCVDLKTPEFAGGNEGNLNTSNLQHGSHGLIMDRCDLGDPRQQWELIESYSEAPIEFDDYWHRESTYGRLRNVFTGECIDVPYGVSYATALQVYPCHTGSNQQWRIFQPLWFG
ncbi:MAG: RICIN domain-containing protein [Myxococcota bacterium]